MSEIASTIAAAVEEQGAGCSVTQFR
jgi:hypothetical protein